MDDTEDDARYPPNPRPPMKPHHYVSSSSARPKAPFRTPQPPPKFGARYTEADDDYEEEDEEEEGEEEEEEEDPEEDPIEMDQPSEDEDDAKQGRSFRRPRDFGGEDGDSSSESRGKRRRIDKLAQGFELAPRLPPPAAGVASSKTPARTSPPDWSEESTFILLDAWADRYIQNGRKSLRSDEWIEVAKQVSQASKVNRSDAQCRNRLDTLKKKYKKEKAAMDLGGAGSRWVYFKKIDALISPPPPLPSAGRQKLQQLPRPAPKLPFGVDAGEYVFPSSGPYKNRYNDNDEIRDSPGDSGSDDDDDDDDKASEDESDGLPPKRVNVSGNRDSSFKMLAESIQKFGEIYEKMEHYKRQQMAELERMRKEFQRDLEVQKRQILERAQVEIAKLNEEHGDEDDDEDREDDNDDDGGSAENLSG